MRTRSIIAAAAVAAITAACGQAAEDRGPPQDDPSCHFGYYWCPTAGEPCALDGKGEGVCRGTCETQIECCFGCWDGAACQPGFEAAACGRAGEECRQCSSCSDGACVP